MENSKVIYNQTNECAVHSNVTLIIIIIITMLLFECIYSPTHKEKIEKLEKENNSLKNIIIKSIENAITKQMKNGNDYEDNN